MIICFDPKFFVYRKAHVDGFGGNQRFSKDSSKQVSARRFKGLNYSFFINARWPQAKRSIEILKLITGNIETFRQVANSDKPPVGGRFQSGTLLNK